MAYRNRLESGRWQRCQPRVRIPPPLPRPPPRRPALTSSRQRLPAGARPRGRRARPAGRGERAAGRPAVVVLARAGRPAAGGLGAARGAAGRGRPGSPLPPPSGCSRPPVLLHLDDDGFRLRVLRGAGPTTAPGPRSRAYAANGWSPGACLVFALARGRRTVVPLHLLDGGTAAADRLDADLRSRLDRAHGQRPAGSDAGGAEVAGFEPARGDEPSTRLAGGRHRPD